MGQAREEMGGLPMPHEAMGDAPGSLERMAGSVFNEEPVSGLDQQKSGGYGTGAITKQPRSKYLTKASGQ